MSSLARGSRARHETSAMRRTTLALLASITWAGCFGTETGNPPFAPELAGDHGAPMGVVPQLGLTEGWLSVASVGLDPCDGEAVIVRTEPAALALAGAQSLEAEPVLDEGEYCALSFDRVVSEAGSPEALRGSTLALDAAAPDGTIVRVRSARTGSLRLAGDPFELSAERGALLVFVDESLLFNGVSLDEATREADGSITIDESSNAALLDRIEEQLPGALFLYRDEDGDGSLSVAERRAGPLGVVP